MKYPDPDGVPAIWEVGDVILDLYDINEIFTGGGMGLVYRVHHRDWREDLAVKSPRPKFFGSKNHQENFVRECVTWIGLGLHPHIVACYYVRLLGGIPRVFAEYVSGGTLKELIESRKLYEGGVQSALVRILDISIQMAWGLHYAHEKGLIHQDVKPANVMLTPEGVVKVTDFGLAKARAMSGEAFVAASQQSILVSSGGMTPAYCSLEQVNKQSLTRKTDIWSWGLSVLEMFAGEVFWHSGAAATEALNFHLENGAEDAAIPKMPETLANLLRECFQQTPEQRPRDLNLIVERLKVIHQSALGRDYGREEGRVTETTADVLNNEGISYHDLGLTTEAKQCFERALVADPHHLEATYNRGLVLWRSGRTTDDKLIQQLEEAGKSHSGDSRMNYLLGLIHLERSDAESALQVLTDIAKGAAQSSEIAHAVLTARAGLGKGGQCLRTFEGHAEGVSSVAISPDGRWGLSGSKDHTLRLWNLASGQCLRAFEGHSDNVNSVAISPDGNWGLSGSGDGTLRLWALASGQCLRTFEGHAEGVSSVAISPDGRWGLSGSKDHTLRLWDLASGQCLRTLAGRLGGVFSVAISPDGRWGLSGSFDETRLWDLASGGCLRTFGEYSGWWVSSVAISPDGNWGLSGSGDGALRLWDLAGGQCLRMFEGHAKGGASVAISPDGRWGLSGGDTTLRLWNLASGQCLRTLEGHSSYVGSVAISPDGRWALSGSRDKTLRLWDLALLGIRSSMATVRPQRLSELSSQGDEFIRALKVAEAHLLRGEMDTAIECLSEARAIHGYERDSRAMSLLGRVAFHSRRSAFQGGWHLRTFKGHTDDVTSVAISPDGRWGLSGCKDGTLRLWDLASGQSLRAFEGHSNNVWTVAISPDGRWGLSGSDDSTLRLWDLASGQCLRVFEELSEYINSVAISPDGCWGLSRRSSENTLRLWDLGSGHSLRTLKGHADDVNSVAFSPDGRWVLSGSSDRTLRLWDLVSGQCLRAFEGHAEGVFSVAISPDGRWGLSGSYDNTLRLWDLVSGQCLRTFERHSDFVNSVAISPDGRWGLSGSEDNTLRLWDLASGQCLRTFEGHAEGVSSVAISPNGCWALSGSGDKTLRLWELDWEYDFPGVVDWDEGARFVLTNFLTLHTSYASELPKDRKPSDDEITGALTRSGRPCWNESDFKQLLHTLACAGYGWIKPEGVRKELMNMAATWDDVGHRSKQELFSR